MQPVKKTTRLQLNANGEGIHAVQIAETTKKK